MVQATTNTGVDILGHLAWGTHLCHFYETKDDLLDIVAPFFKAGLENNEFCVWIISDPVDTELARTALRRVVPDAEYHLAADDLQILSNSNAAGGARQGIHIVPHTKWYLHDGRFDGERVRSVWHNIYEEAVKNGYDGVRANAVESWLTKADWADFIKYEGSLDTSLGNRRMIVLCSYPIDKAPANALLDLVGTHEFALACRDRKWEIVETPDLKEAKSEIRLLNNNLEQSLADRTEQLTTANDKLRKEITERIRAEEEARRSEKRVREIIDALPVMAWSIDAEGRVEFFNQRFIDYAGVTLEQYLADPRIVIHPADVKSMYDAWYLRREKGIAHEDEIRMRRADGQFRWFLIRRTPLKDEHGRIVKWYGVSVDIEDRKRAEERLREDEYKLREAERIAHLGYWEYDLDTDRVTLSDEAARILGRPATQLGLSHPGDEVREVIHPDDRAIFDEMLQRARSGRSELDFEYRVVHPRGEIRYVKKTADVIRGPDGKPLRAIGAVQDVTSRKIAEDQLRRLTAKLNSAREESAARIAREIHDELGGALSALRWDLEEVTETVSSVTAEDAGVSKKLQVLTARIDNIVDSVRRIASELRPAALDEFGLFEALLLYASQFEQRTGITINLKSVAETANVGVETANAMFRIVQEALTNVLRHAAATRVDIGMRHAGDQCILTITDNGRGIEQAEQNERGTFGLVGMRERATLLGGELTVEGREGQGTTITLRVPVADAGSHPPTTRGGG